LAWRPAGLPYRAERQVFDEEFREAIAVSYRTVYSGMDERRTTAADCKSAAQEKAVADSRKVRSAVGEMLVVTRRRLPHWQVGGVTYFLTFRLKHRSERPHRGADLQSAKERTETSPLNRDERAVVKDAILFWHRKRWLVHVLTVMPDHVHLLVSPLQQKPGAWFSISKILQSVKRHAARVINARRGTTGQSLWQVEGYDHIVRNDEDLDDTFAYILGNAVRAGLVSDPWEWDGLWYEGQDSEGLCPR